MQKKRKNLLPYVTKFCTVLNLLLTVLLNKTKFRAPESRFLAFPLDYHFGLQRTNEQQIMPLASSKNVLPFKSSCCYGANLSLKVVPPGYLVKSRTLIKLIKNKIFIKSV